MSKPPKKWKMAVLIWIAIYPTVTLIAMTFGEHFEKIKPLPLQTLASTLIVVPICVFAVVPVLKKCQVFGIELETNKIFQVSNVLDPEKLRSISNGLK